MHSHANDAEDQVAPAQRTSGDAASVRRPATGTHDEVPTSRPDTGLGHSPRPDGQGAPATHSAHDESVVRGLMFSSMNSRAAKLDDAPEAERFAKNPHRELESDVSRELQTGVPGTFGVRHLRPWRNVACSIRSGSGQCRPLLLARGTRQGRSRSGTRTGLDQRRSVRAAFPCTHLRGH